MAISSARIDEYSVPQMKGSAPNSPATGSHVLVRQKSKPNFWIDSHDCRASSTPMADDDERAAQRRRRRCRGGIRGRASASDAAYETLIFCERGHLSSFTTLSGSGA